MFLTSFSYKHFQKVLLETPTCLNVKQKLNSYHMILEDIKVIFITYTIRILNYIQEEIQVIILTTALLMRNQAKLKIQKEKVCDVYINGCV